MLVKRDYHLNVYVDGELVDYVNANTLRAALEYFLMYSSSKFIPLDSSSIINLEIKRNVYGTVENSLELDL